MRPDWAGYVDSEKPDRVHTEEEHVFVGIDDRVTTPQVARRLFGVIQFNLSASDLEHVRALELRLIGRDAKTLNPTGKGTWRLAVVDLAAKAQPADVTFADVRDAPVAAMVAPDLADADLGLGAVNAFVLTGGALDALLSLAGVSGRVTFRLELSASRKGIRHIFDWDARNDQSPVLEPSSGDSSAFKGDNRMEPLFRLALVRPAIAQDPANPSISTKQDTPFQVELAKAVNSNTPREASQEVARAFVSGQDFLGQPEANPVGAKLAALAASLDQLEIQSVVSHDAVVKAVRDAFGADPKNLVQDNVLAGPMARLRDSLLSIKQLQEEHGRPIEALTNQLRDMELIVTLSEDDTFPATGAELRRYRRRSLALPTATELQSILSTAKLEEARRKSAAEAEAERQKLAAELLATYRGISTAITELTGLSSDHFNTTPQAAQAGTTPPALLSATGVLTRQTAFIDKLSSLNLEQIQTALERGGNLDPLHAQDVAGASHAAALAQTVLASGPSPLSGSTAFAPLTPNEVAFRLKPSAAGALSAATNAILGKRNLGIADHALDQIVATLQSDLNAAGTDLDSMYGMPMQQILTRIGGTLVTIATPIAITQPGPGAAPMELRILAVDDRIPHTRGEVAPAGVADLLIVKQQLIGYEATDVAHIENVLKGERKEREHTSRRETEELTFRETEITSAEERELESTNRFEMTRETSATLKEDASLKAGLKVSGKYGPTVEFSASAEGSLSRSKEEATRTAAKFSQDVTERSSRKITERVLERASLRVTTEVIERNAHELNNVNGTGHISGVYQWVNKVYYAQMFNYGLRTMFDFMVPEPAAFLAAAMKAAHAHAVELQKPPEFTVKPNQVTDDVTAIGYYGTWARLYGATDVVPPPEIYKTKALDFKAGGGDSKTDYTHSGQIAIDEGYRAVQGCVSELMNFWVGSAAVDVVLGRRPHRFGVFDSWVWVTDLSDERDTVPFALKTFQVADVAVAVEVKCQRTDRAMEKWRLDTYAKLLTAYKARLAEYEERLAALQVQAGVVIEGANPAQNLETMNDELKKHCVSILTDQHYDLFDAIDIAWSNGLPQIDVFEAEGEGAYVRFFEQAFEWEHMTWVTYPYFWGRKTQWGERLAFEDPDPLFNQFLKAGYCRVSVPARPGFEGAIDHFMTYGELWNGGPLPTISSPLYLPIADEIAERLDRPGDEVPQGDPWLVRIPTTLVKLRADDRLPKWKKVGDEWVPDE